MLRHTSLTLARIEQLAPRIRERIYSEKRPLKAVYAGPVERISHEKAQRLLYSPAPIGLSLGPLWATFWFRLSGSVPKEWEGKRIDLLWASHSEATLWKDGQPVQGLNFEPTTSTCIRPDAKLWDEAPAHAVVNLEVEVACNHLCGYDFKELPSYPTVSPFVFEQADIAVFDPAAWNLYYDFIVLVDLLKRTDPQAATSWGGFLLSSLNTIVNELRLDDRKTWKAARERLASLLAHHNASYQHEVSAMGHAHIDTAWLWPLAETERKCVRTFTNVLAYIDDYPEYRFVCSQAQQYAWIRDKYPAVFERIKRAVKKGNWIPVGGTWIEPDCNLPSGESLIRQFLYGQRFFEKEFGFRCKEFWNPDVFGYSGALPQIIRGVGLQHFLTQKLSWNQFNKPMHHNFYWEGIDGSRVLTHFPPADTYIGMWSGFPLRDLLYTASNFKDHDRSNESIFLFGYGDGGGGPTKEMLEVFRRVRDLQGVPRTVQRSPSEFFIRLERSLTDVPVVVGELYFELHRGTYTSQAQIKRHNRQAELLLRETELLGVIAVREKGSDYPSAEMERLWKLLLLNQFHDIIPGSSISEVYSDSARQFQDLFDSCRAMNQKFRQLLSTTGNRFSVLNTCGWERTDLVEAPVPSESGQTSFDGKHLVRVQAPSLGTAPLQSTFIDNEAVRAYEESRDLIMENDQIIARFSRSGQLIQLWDKIAQRVVITPEKPGNQFILFEDYPTSYDAWEVDVSHLETRCPIPPAGKFSIIESGPLRAGLEFQYAFGKSELSQRVFLHRGDRLLRFDCKVNWKEQHKFLKVEFPVQVRCEEAAYEIQFGYVRRPTHFNTTYDIARFESCAQRWADLSQPDYGVALLNDCKYGYSVHDSKLTLSLLRAPTYPDPEADQGEHHFKYALYPHKGGLVEARVPHKAYEFNAPLTVMKESASLRSWLSINSPNLIIDTVKKAEDSEAIIVRLYEAYGTSGMANIFSSLKIRSANAVNMLEDTEHSLDWSEGSLSFNYHPFQILSFKLQ